MDLFDSEVQGLERLRKYGSLLYGEPQPLGEELGPYSVGERLHHSIHRGTFTEMGDDVKLSTCISLVWNEKISLCAARMAYSTSV